MPQYSDPNFWKGKRVWISGHTGFKGSWLSLWLLHWGAIVEGFSLNPDETSGPSLYRSLSLEKDLYNDCRGDINDMNLLLEKINIFQPEIVFHLAAQSLVSSSYIDPILTWNTNVIGSCNVLEAVRSLNQSCIAIMITTDKVYDNKEWDFAYRENDPLGGFDPYSSSKAAAELAISSWRSSFCGTLNHQNSNLLIASARAGNVIGGGDWASNRIVPDSIKSLIKSKPIQVRSPSSRRPWQHVLEPLGGYLLLAEKLYSNSSLAKAFNFGPDQSANRSVKELVETILSFWPGEWVDKSNTDSPHEALRLDLSTDRAFHQLDWTPTWSFEKTISETIKWYKGFNDGLSPKDLCIEQIEDFNKANY